MVSTGYWVLSLSLFIKLEVYALIIKKKAMQIIWVNSLVEKYLVNGGNSVEKFGENSKIFGVNEKSSV